MITKEEIEILKNSNNDTQKKAEYDQAMNVFKKQSAEAVERFERVIDESFRNRIKFNRENHENKKSIIVSFKTLNLYQIAALSHIIKKYNEAGFKIFCLDKKLKHISQILKHPSDCLRPWTKEYDYTFERNNEQALNVAREYDYIVKYITNIENFYVKLKQTQKYDIFELDFRESNEEYRIKDILNGLSLRFLNTISDEPVCFADEKILEFSLED